MKNKTIIALLMLLVLGGCAEKHSVELHRGGKGEAGEVGEAGKNGHSLVSEYVEGADLECENGGTRLDIYLDIDDSLSVSESDQYQNSLVACNGLNGARGANGLAGENGRQGAAGPQGATGAQGLAGPAGPRGDTGPQGETGAMGPAGSGAIVTALTATRCTAVAGSSPTYYVESGKLYESAGCDSDDQVQLQVGETVWVAGKVLVNRDSSGLRSINFN